MNRLLRTVRAYGSSMALQISVSKGGAGFARVLEVLGRARIRGGAPAEPIGVPMKELGGTKLYVRPGTSDLRNASYYYRGGLFSPAPEIAGQDLRQIVELGSNMGAALSALACRYPNARLLGVEPDPGNAELARRNVAGFGSRCEVVTAGIWDVDAELVVDRTSSHGEHGFTIRERVAADPPSLSGIRALSIDSLLARHMPDGEIDYVHMTIEGTEPRVLSRGGAWVRRVRSLRVEAHPSFGYPAAALIADLEQLGYRARPDAALPDKWIFATRA